MEILSAHVHRFFTRLQDGSEVYVTVEVKNGAPTLSREVADEVAQSVQLSLEQFVGPPQPVARLLAFAQGA